MLSGFQRLQADITAAGYGSALAVTPIANTNDDHPVAMLRLPVIDMLTGELSGETGKLLTPFATLTGSAESYSVISIATSRISLLKPVLTGYAGRVGSTGVFTPNMFPDLLRAFTTRLSEDLIEHGVTPTQDRVVNLFTFRYARGLGYTVASNRPPLPKKVYDWFAADTDPRVTVLAFSKMLNPTFDGDSRVPIKDAEHVESMSIEFLRSLYAPDPLLFDFSAYV